MTTSAEQPRLQLPGAGVTPGKALWAADSLRAGWLPEADAIAHDTEKTCVVLVVVGPGAYAKDVAYVRPLGGRSAGRLAPCGNLEPISGWAS